MRTLAVVVTLAAGLSACGAGSTPASTEGPGPRAPGSTVEEIAHDDGSPPITEPPDEGLYRVVGEVVEMPGEPPRICFGWTLGVFTGCSDPSVEIVGMDWDALGVAPADGARVGFATLTGRFEGERFVLSEPPDRPVPVAPMVDGLDFSTVCPPPPDGWAVLDESTTTEEALDAARRYVESRSDAAGFWIDWSGIPSGGGGDAPMNDPRGAILNARFTGDLAAHETALRQVWGGGLCVARGQHTWDEMQDIERTLLAELGPVMTALHPRHALVLVHLVVPKEGYRQHDLDERFGPDVVLVTSAFRPLTP
jgi:hypothetical protein